MYHGEGRDCLAGPVGRTPLDGDIRGRTTLEGGGKGGTPLEEAQKSRREGRTLQEGKQEVGGKGGTPSRGRWGSEQDA